MSNYFQSAFNINESHNSACQIQIATSNHSLISIGTDQFISQYSLSQSPKISSVQNPEQYQVCTIAIHPINKNSLVVGTTNGFVLSLTHNESISSFQINPSKILYKIPNASNIVSNESRIRSLVFTEDGKYLLIATNQSACIVYDWKNKRFFKHKLQNDSQIVSITVDYRNFCFCLIDFDGKASIYSFQKQEQAQKMELQDINNSDSQDPFAQMNSKQQKISLKYLTSCKIASPTLLKKYYTSNISCSFNNVQSSFLSQTLYLPGQTTLQKLEINLPPSAFGSTYSLITNIIHTKQILKVIWLRNQNSQQGLLLTVTQTEGVIWHQNKGQKLMIFSFGILFDQQNLEIKSLFVRKFRQHSNWGFAMIPKYLDSYNGFGTKIYDFKGFSQLQAQISRRVNSQQKENELNLQVLQESSKKIKQIKQKIRNKPFQSIAAKLIPSFPQMLLSQGYQEHDKCKFLYYNNIGCVIQRIDDVFGSVLEFQFHDRSKITRIKLPSDKAYEFFSLCPDTFVYASTSALHVQSQKYLKQNFQWQFQWDNIQGVSIGGEWICAVNKGQIKIFDWTGNELHSVDFDRRYVAMAAYEDLLAIVYHSSIPLYGVQSLKMLIFQVTTKTVKMIRDTMVVCKPNCNLKWFGFSQQGMIVSQDDGQNVRVYNFTKDEWQLTLSLDPTAQRLFIQHIQNYEIYGFRLDQKYPNEPRVFPRSLPKKINFDLTNYKVEYLSLEENEYIKKHKLSLLWLQHQKYRFSKWYKYKYSRNKQNRWYQRSLSIKSQEEIKVSQAQYDIKLMEYLKKYIKINKHTENDSVWKKVLLLCQNLAFYDQTRSKLNQILMESDIRTKPSREVSRLRCQMYNPEIKLPMKKKLSQLDRLQEMMGLSWVNIKQNQLMELQ